MEILSYVLEGAIKHQDSMGHREVLRPGELQRMSAGRGVTQSGLLFNADPVGRWPTTVHENTNRAFIATYGPIYRAESAEARRGPRINNDVDCPA